MQTIKTAVVVVLLLVVLYGAYIAINGSETELPPELQNMLANDSGMDVDVSMPGFNSAGLTPGSGLKPGSPFGGSPGLTPGSGLTAAPSSIFGSPPGNASAAPPQPLAPPKLTSIPSLPTATESAPAATENSATGPAKLEPPSVFSLNVANSEPTEPKNNPAPAVPPPSTTLAAPKPLDTANSMTFPGKVASQTTVASEVIQPLPPNSLNVPESSKSDGELTSASDKKANITGRSFENAKKAAIEQVDRGEFKEALAKMSIFYNSPELTAEQNLDLINLLDSLAGETIYSRRHLLDTPYVVGPGETIDDLAKRFEVPTELLAKINGVDMTMGLTPGTKLKIFRGPFRAEVDVNRHEMTVFLGDLYAGRFPVSTGADPKPTEGVFQVLDKQRNRNYYGKGGIQIDGNDPRNPYGGWWMDLGQDISIHGSPENPAGDNNGLGCISLSPLDAGDVFSMLSRGSQVTIKR